MAHPPFTIGLRLMLATAEAAPGSAELNRDKLIDVAQRERTSRPLAPDVLPSRADGDALLGRTFADHPMVNVSGTLEAGGVTRPAGTGGRQAFVLAEIVVLPDLAPIPPGGAFPDVTDEVVAGPILVHGRRWPTFDDPVDEEREALTLLEEVSREVPDALWRRDG